MMNDAIFMPISIMFFFCVCEMVNMLTCNNFALPMDQDVNDYFDIYDKNKDNRKSSRNSESHMSQLICIDWLTQSVRYEKMSDLP